MGRLEAIRLSPFDVVGAQALGLWSRLAMGAGAVPRPRLDDQEAEALLAQIITRDTVHTHTNTHKASHSAGETAVAVVGNEGQEESKRERKGL